MRGFLLRESISARSPAWQSGGGRFYFFREGVAMPARFMFRTISVILIAFMLLSAVPPAASGQAPEPPPPERFERQRDLSASRYPGEMPQAPGTLAPQAPDALTDWSKLAFMRYVEADDNWEIYRANGDGSSQNSPDNGLCRRCWPRISRGCTGVVFTSNRNGNDDIYKMNMDGTRSCPAYE